jgi:diguanylate cyclase (GGDEF)-like protein
VTLLIGRNPALAATLRNPDARSSHLEDSRAGLQFLATMFPGAIAQASLTTADGRELVRVVNGESVGRRMLQPDATSSPYFGPTMASPPSEVYQAEPYISTVTGLPVMSTSTPIQDAVGDRLGLVHLELSLSTFRDEMVRHAHGARLVAIDTVSGKPVVDTAPGTGGRVERQHGGSYGTPGRVTASHVMPSLSGNANRWVIVAVAAHPTPDIVGSFGSVPLGMLGLAALLALFAFLGLRASNRELKRQANSDGLTGLPNRRKLMTELARVTARHEHTVLMLLDLNGFKTYNDSFGHLAGDALLTRLGHALEEAVAPWGHAYRLGGDEFCVIASNAPPDMLEDLAASALSEHGDGFEVTASLGSVMLPDEAASAEEALLLVDQRMYRHKAGGRPSAQGQMQAVLLQALSERHPELENHSDGVGELAVAIAADMGLDGIGIENVRTGGELHDIGKVAIPDAIISKPGPLDDEEWAFIKRHTVIGERILAAAPGLAHVALMVRASHERWDGHGYPDGLRGEAIPLGARIIAVCDSFDAMVSPRPYAPPKTVEDALAELHRCSGAQFDPQVVESFARVWATRPVSLVAA